MYFEDTVYVTHIGMEPVWVHNIVGARIHKFVKEKGTGNDVWMCIVKLKKLNI